MKIVSVMPIKIHSKRLPNKNLLKLGDTFLLNHNLKTLLSLDMLDDIYVYCSQESIMEYVPKGVKFLQRDVRLDSDESNFTQIFEAFSAVVCADIYVYTHATAPFLSQKSLQACINSVLKEGYDSAFSATRIQDFLWTKDFVPLNFDAHNVPRSQDLEVIYRETSGVYVFKNEVFRELRRRIGNNPKAIEVSFKEAIDINTKEDFELAEIIQSHDRFNVCVSVCNDGGVRVDSLHTSDTQERSSCIEIIKGDQMPKILDCTLRDGGYVVDWEFGEQNIIQMIDGLCAAHIDFIECGYLNSQIHAPNKSIFTSIERIAEVLPTDRGVSKFLAMADVTQFRPQDITNRSGKSIDGLRIVFYKHQIQEALALCQQSIQCGYETFMQPMVTIDYTLQEYENLIQELCKLDIQCISIVDSFGYMTKRDIRRYFDVIDSLAPKQMMIGFHSHNNMDLAFNCAQDILEYDTKRTLVIDASLEGMGRGAGNLYTELITQYYNAMLTPKYDIQKILDLISAYIEPIKKHKQWGYSPYFFITALYGCHPNFATYLLEIEPSISVSEFKEFVRLIPADMRTKCKKPYVEELYRIFSSRGGGAI
ncbi:MAG TPA: hypothetical protein IAA33_03645 [Candidatus Helicobacter avicola]|nr:hypothetical protein [Candidatus Helicobacter avicola]